MPVVGKGRGKYHTPSQAAKLFGNTNAITSRDTVMTNGASSNGGGFGGGGFGGGSTFDSKPAGGDGWGMVGATDNGGGDGGFGNGGGFGGGGFGGGGFGGGGFGDSSAGGGNTDRFADPDKEVDITIQVYNGNLPRIIGKGGSSIQQISADSSARVDIDKDGGDGETTPIKISGSQLNVDHAKKLIDEICQKFKGIVGAANGGGGGGGGFGGGGFGGGEETTVDIWIPEDKCGRVIGRGGSKIGEIQDDTGANVKVHGRETAEDGKVMITLTGSTGSCEKAKKIIEELTAERGGGGGGGGYNPTGPQVMLDMWVETGRLGRLIGKGGCKIREISDEYNIRIDISKDNIKDQDTGVVLTGSDEDTKRAKVYIDELTERDQMESNDFGAAEEETGGW